MFIPYPLSVRPIIKEKIWGGNFLKKIFKIKNKKNIGEIWFFADQKKESSIIQNGVYKGKRLSDIYKEYGKEMLGNALFQKYKRNFPVLIKFIEAKENLSVQVHPDDEFALKNENSPGKTEAWYIINASRNTEIFLGTKKKLDRKLEFDKKIIKILKKYRVKKYDCFYIPAGTLHTLLKGNVILEIQQNSDITYRVYDWDRIINGKPRQLHIDKARKVIKYEKKAGKIKKKILIFDNNYKVNCLIKCKYFDLYETIIEKKHKKCYTVKRPSLLTVISGDLIMFHSNKIYRLKKGDVIFLPVNILKFSIMAKEKARFVLTEIK